MSLNHIVAPQGEKAIDAEFKNLTVESITVSGTSNVLDLVSGSYDNLDVTGITQIRTYQGLSAVVNNFTGGVDGQKILVSAYGQSNASIITFNHLSSSGSGDQLIFIDSEVSETLPANPLAIPRNAYGLLTYLEATGLWYFSKISQ
jgi:hypothetical protein